MRPSTRAALQRAAELTRNGHLVDGLKAGESAINRADDDEHAEIQQWLTDHTDDFINRRG